MTVNSLMTQLGMPKFAAAAELDLQFFNSLYLYNGTYRTSLANVPGWSYTRTDTNGTATSLDLAGNVIQFATGVPRITNRGILVEETRTNTVAQSISVGNTGWTRRTNYTVVSTTIDAPDGTNTAVRINNSANLFASEGVFSNNSAVANAQYACTVYARANTASAARLVLKNANSDVIVAETGFVLTSAWQRLVLVGTTAGGAAGYRFEISTDGVVGSIDLWGAQVEAGAFATSPIITTGAAGTRGAENAFVTGLAGLPPFTFFTEGDAGASGFPQYGAIDDGTSNNKVAHLRVGSANNVYVEITSGGGATGANVGPTGVVFAGQTTKIASSVIATGVRASRDGSAIATATRTVNALNRLCVGNATGTLPANGYVRRIRVLPYAATNAELQALTAP